MIGLYGVYISDMYDSEKINFISELYKFLGSFVGQIEEKYLIVSNFEDSSNSENIITIFNRHFVKYIDNCEMKVYRE